MQSIGPFSLCSNAYESCKLKASHFTSLSLNSIISIHQSTGILPNLRVIRKTKYMIDIRSFVSVSNANSYLFQAREPEEKIKVGASSCFLNLKKLENKMSTTWAVLKSLKMNPGLHTASVTRSFKYH